MSAQPAGVLPIRFAWLARIPETLEQIAATDPDAAAALRKQIAGYTTLG